MSSETSSYYTNDEICPSCGCSNGAHYVQCPVFLGKQELPEQIPLSVPEPMVEFKSGAKRSEKALRYDLIPPRALRRLAERYTMGAEKYGDENWKKGLLDPEYVKQFEAHLIEHWVRWKLDGCKKDDNLAAMAWGCFALMEAEEAQKENK